MGVSPAMGTHPAANMCFEKYASTSVPSCSFPTSPLTRFPDGWPTTISAVESWSFANCGKQWANTDYTHRVAMVKAPPQRYRWYHRFTRRRHDVIRIAVVVHALCDRDEVPVPEWVWQHRSDSDIGLIASRRRASDWWLGNGNAPAACAYHRVWFDPASIEDHRIHGFTRVE